MVELITNISLSIMSAFKSDLSLGLHVREIAKRMGVNHTTILPHLNLLEKKGFLKSRNVGKNREFSLNLQNNSLRELLLLAEKRLLLERISKDLFLKELHSEICDAGIDACIVIFGSYASDTHTKASDLDLLCIGKMTENEKNLLKNIGRVYKRALHIVNLSRKGFRDASEKKAAMISEVAKNYLVLRNAETFLDELWRRNEKRTI